MKILQGRHARNLEEATLLAFQEAGKDDMSADIASLFASAMDVDKLHAESEGSINKAVRGRHGRNARWHGKQRFIPVPELQWNISPIPQLVIVVRAYLVCPGEAETNYDSHSHILVGTIGKPEVLVIPMTFLWALLDDDLGRFRLVAKDSSHTTWEIPGAKAVQLPTDFANKLAEIFKRKPVAMWLDHFGSQGRSVKPLVVGSLLGLQFQSAARDTPLAQQPYTPEQLVTVLEAMAYTRAEAEAMVRRALPELKVDHTFEEALRIVLQYAGKGG